jgi:hypothetical protein
MTTMALEADDERVGRREVHCDICEGVGAALRIDLRVFRSVHKPYRHLYLATYAAIVSAQQVTPDLIRRMRVGTLSAHTGYTCAKKI